MRENASSTRLFAELRRFARQRKPAQVADVAPLLVRFLAGCASVVVEERSNGIVLRFEPGPPSTTVLSGFLHRAPLALLTSAERAIAGELRAGLTRAQIARLRGVSPNTVKSQIRQIFRKLDIDSRLDLVRLLGP